MSLEPKPLLQALGGQVCQPPPVWLMRQAGRHLPEYRDVRYKAGGFLDLVTDPARAAEVTLQPVRRYGLDGSILFSDILVVPWALGQDLRFETGEGPKLGPLPARLSADILDMQVLAPIFETLRRLKTALQGSTVTQLGFVGAPWTVATYMIEGGKPGFERSRAYLKTPSASTLLDVLIKATLVYAKAQIAAGAEVIQIFDSWAGQLDEAELETWCLEPLAILAEALAPTPVILFPRGASKTLAWFKERLGSGFGFGLGEEADLDQAQRASQGQICLQGNLSPQILLGPVKEQERAIATLLSRTQGTPHIVNLGHGVDKATEPARVQALVDQVKAG